MWCYQGKGRCNVLWAYRGMKLRTGKCHEDCGMGAEEESTSYGKSGQDVIWIYAGKRNNRCSLYIRKDAEGILQQGELLKIHVICGATMRVSAGS